MVGGGGVGGGGGRAKWLLRTRMYTSRVYIIIYVYKGGRPRRPVDVEEKQAIRRPAGVRRAQRPLINLTNGGGARGQRQGCDPKWNIRSDLSRRRQFFRSTLVYAVSRFAPPPPRKYPFRANIRRHSSIAVVQPAVLHKGLAQLSAMDLTPKTYYLFVSTSVPTTHPRVLHSFIVTRLARFKRIFTTTVLRSHEWRATIVLYGLKFRFFVQQSTIYTCTVVIPARFYWHYALL